MPTSFSISTREISAPDHQALHARITGHTGCDEQTASILRNLERFGTDTTIGYFDVTPTPLNRYYRGAPTMAWTVRAVRRQFGF